MKRVNEDSDDEDKSGPHCGPNRVGITCWEHPCSNVYVPIELYTSHVQQYHDHCCAQCGKNLATDRLLNLHLEEMHNPFNADRARYHCFEELCKEDFETQRERIKHLIEAHNYPESFDFDIVRNGSQFD